MIIFLTFATFQVLAPQLVSAAVMYQVLNGVVVHAALLPNTPTFQLQPDAPTEAAFLAAFPGALSVEAIG